MNKFEALGLEPAIVSALEKKGYETPTPIQEKVIPILLQGGKNVIGQAQTGTGKTAAFGLPIIQNIKANSKDVQAIILAPTRELAIQVANEIDSFSGAKKIKVATVYGGSSIDKQIMQLRNGVEVVVGTPGRVIDLMKRKKLRIENIKYFVLDEADEMLNMGFIEDIEWILSQTNEDKQVLCFSATMPNKIKKLAKRYMGDYEILAVEKTELTTENTEQKYYPVFPKDKVRILKRVISLADDFYGIVFTNTKREADEVTRQLMESNVKAEALHGDIAQSQRERILGRFKARKSSVLVATDVAARGIDVNDLTHVINYSVPQDPEAYVHRIGRTGRAGKKGEAITFVEQKEYKQLLYIQSLIKVDIKKELMPSTDELIVAKEEEIKEKIESVNTEKINDVYVKMAKELLENDNPETVLAKTLQVGFYKELDPKAYAAIKQPNDLTKKGNATEQRLFIGMGKKDGFESEKLRTFLMEGSGIDESAFLDTFILDEFSFVTLPIEEAEIVLSAFKKKKVQGKSLITKAKERSGGGGGGGRNRSGGGGGRSFGGGKKRSGGGYSGNKRSGGGGSSSGRRSSGSSGGGSKSYSGSFKKRR